MKFYLFFALFLQLHSLTAQETIWFNKKWEKTSEKNGVFFRPNPKKIKKGYWIVDFYKNGDVKREGFSKTNNSSKNNFEGLVIEYHKNGLTAIKSLYKKGKLHGIVNEYFETGELKKQYRYRDGIKDGIWKEFHKSGKIKTKGRYNEGEKVGVWKTYYKNVYESILDY